MADDITHACAASCAICRTIAVVGLSAEWHRPSYFAAKYMQQHGYRIVPVNPRYDSILGERSYAQRWRTSRMPVDMVDVFRRSRRRAADRAQRGRHRREVPVAADRRAQRRGRCAGARRGPGLGDGPLREDRTRAAVRRPALGRRQHRRDLGAAAGRAGPSHGRPHASSPRPWPSTPGRSPTPRPARARCRSTRPPASCSTAPTTRPACSTCRPSATSTRA